jgi:hypothetical protein
VDHGIGAVTSGLPTTTGALFTNTTFTLTVTNAAGMAATVSATVTVVSHTGSMTISRAQHSACRLSDGNVLLSGGATNDLPGLTATAEIFDQTSGTFMATGNMSVARYHHTETLLDNGLVLMAGGGFDSARTSAELYDPATGLFTPTGQMNRARSDHTATRLRSGEVLVAGGSDNTAEIYDPSTGLFSPPVNMLASHVLHTAALLLDGTVLIAGGDGPTAEVYDPSSGSFRRVGDLIDTRQAHTAVLLPDGTVLLTGGGYWFPLGGDYYFPAGPPYLVPLKSAELFDPTAGSFSFIGNMNFEREFHTAALLQDGRVLIAGGAIVVDPALYVTNSAELYDPTAPGPFVPTGDMAFPREGHTATSLLDGTVLVAGGSDSFGTPLSSAEIYDPVSERFR